MSGSRVREQFHPSVGPLVHARRSSPHSSHPLAPLCPLPWAGTPSLWGQAGIGQRCRQSRARGRQATSPDPGWQAWHLPEHHGACWDSWSIPVVQALDLEPVGRRGLAAGRRCWGGHGGTELLCQGPLGMPALGQLLCHRSQHRASLGSPTHPRHWSDPCASAPRWSSHGQGLAALHRGSGTAGIPHPLPSPQVESAGCNRGRRPSAP